MKPGHRTVDVDGLEVDLVVFPPSVDLARALERVAEGDGEGILSPREREIYEGFRYEKRRGDWLSGRMAAKVVLLRHLGEEGLHPSRVEVLPEESRLPLAYRVSGDGGQERIGVSISISHRGGAAAAAVLPERLGCVGVDLEVMEPRSEALAEDSFTARELEVMHAIGPPAGQWGIAIIWSLKEAALKAAGLGLSVPTTDAEVVSLDVEAGRAEVHLWGEAAAGRERRVASARLSLEPPLIVTVAVVAPTGA